MTPKQRREEIKRILGFLDEGNHMTFKRMYANGDLDKDIDQVVDSMPGWQLEWALTQCLNSYHRIFEILKS